MPCGTTLGSPVVTCGALAITTIRAASSFVGAISVAHVRLAALASLQFRSQMTDAAPLGGPVVGRVMTVAPVTRGIAGSIMVTIVVSARLTRCSGRTHCGGHGGSRSGRDSGNKRCRWCRGRSRSGCRSGNKRYSGRCGRSRSWGGGGSHLNKGGTATWLRVRVVAVVPNGTTLCSPELAVRALAITTIRATSSMVSAVGVTDPRCAALASL